MVEIVIDGPKNEHYFFRPLSRNLRGTFDILRTREPCAMELRAKYPTPIPGLHVILDAEKRMFAIVDPLHEVSNVDLREKIEARGLRLGPARQEFTDVDVDSFAFWLYRAVEAGLAKLVSGTWPKFDETKVRRNYLIAPQQRDPRDERIDRLEAMNRQAMAMLCAQLPAERRKELTTLFEG